MLVVIQLLINFLSALLNYPQCVSQLISHFPPQPISLHPYKPLLPIPILCLSHLFLPPFNLSPSSHPHPASTLLFPPVFSRHLHPLTLCTTLTSSLHLSPRLQTHYFGLWFQGKTQAPAHRWVELEKPLKKQLDKFGNEPLLFFGVMFYVPSVSRLEQEATR